VQCHPNDVQQAKESTEDVIRKQPSVATKYFRVETTESLKIGRAMLQQPKQQCQDSREEEYGSRIPHTPKQQLDQDIRHDNLVQDDGDNVVGEGEGVEEERASYRGPEFPVKDWRSAADDSSPYCDANTGEEEDWVGDVGGKDRVSYKVLVGGLHLDLLVPVVVV